MSTGRAGGRCARSLFAPKWGRRLVPDTKQGGGQTASDLYRMCSSLFPLRFKSAGGVQTRMDRGSPLCPLRPLQKIGLPNVESSP